MSISVVISVGYMVGLLLLGMYKDESERPLRQARRVEIARRIEKNADREYADRFVRYYPIPYLWMSDWLIDIEPTPDEDKAQSMVIENNIFDFKCQKQ